MKKLFYLVLVVLIVLVLGSFINKNVDSSPSATADVIDVIACSCLLCLFCSVVVYAVMMRYLLVNGSRYMYLLISRDTVVYD